MHSFEIRSALPALFLLTALGCVPVSAADGTPTAKPDAVSAFYSGLAAMKMGLFERAAADLGRAAELLPGEPAVHADLGVLAMRRGDDAAAREHFQQARELAPEDARIALLLGQVERRSGNAGAAVEWFRRAAALEPAALKPRYALVTALEAGDEGKHAATIRELVAGLVADDPDNPALRLKQVRVLAGAGDRGELAAAIEGLSAFAGAWSEAAREQLESLREAMASDGDVAVRATVLRNVLLREPGFREGLERVQVPDQLGGEAIEHFIATPVPEARPAEPDTALSWRPEPEDGSWSGGRGVLVLPGGGPGAVIAAAGGGLPEETAALPGLTGPLDDQGALAVDLDNDGRFEIVTATAGGVRFFRRDDAGGFAAFDPGLPAATAGGRFHGAWAADLEMDGDMDLLLGPDSGPPVVLQNDGDGTFTRRDAFESVQGLRALVWADLDGDGVPDVAALDAGGDLHRFHNARAWSYEPAAPLAGDHVALAVTDPGGDGRMELVALSADGDLVLSPDAGPQEPGRWSSMPSGVGPGEARLYAADLDNNGAQDLLASAGGESAAWLTGPEGSRVRLERELPWRVAAVRELTGDGLLDLVGLDGEGRVLRLVAGGERDYGWQAIRPRALENAGDHRINTYGLGGQVEIRSGPAVQRRVVDAPEVHFGLGERDRADVAWILWPNGTSQAVFDLEPRRSVEAVQRLKGSCPWVFARDGQGLAFVTDFLWRSPLGMRINTFDTVIQTEDRVRIPEEALAAVDGAYEVRITAELWETHFVDGVSLLVVDHPPGTEMFVDESFSREAPRLEPILTSTPRPVGRVVDHRGRDWTAEARELDGRYVAGLELGRYQGIAEPHHVEIDLSGAPLGEHPVLLASGWVYPTDTSINVAIGQGDAVKPRGLSLEVPTADGRWVVVRPDIGFPSGKTKTMVIDLDGVFRPGAPRKLRLGTNLEVYWDRLAVAGRRPDVEPRVRALGTRVAELRYRGFSETVAPRRSTPEVPVYDRLQGTGQRWSDLAGYHTRFGDVRELLAGPDDRYVIMDGGTELLLRFDAPPPAQGLERDFVLVGHGWVKDGDYNTKFSRTVLPLPSRSDPTYDTPPTTLEEDPVYRRHAKDWQRYHTRYVSPERFLSGLREP